MCSGSKAGSYLRLIDFCITQLQDCLEDGDEAVEVVFDVLLGVVQCVPHAGLPNERTTDDLWRDKWTALSGPLSRKRSRPVARP